MEFTVYTQETAPTESKEVIDEVIKTYGFLPNLFGVLAASPMGPRAYLELNKILDQTSLSPTEVQIVLLTTSYENNCTYCMAAHTGVANMQKVPEDVVQAIRDGKLIADKKLQGLRAFTESVVQTRGWPTAEAIKAFADAGYTQAQVVEVMIGVATKTFTNYLNHMVNTPLDDAFAPFVWKKPQTT